MDKRRKELLAVCKTLEAPDDYVLESVHIARYGTELEVMGRLYEIDETLGGHQCTQKSR